VQISPSSGAGAGGGYLWGVDVYTGVVYPISTSTLSVESVVRLPGGNIGQVSSHGGSLAVQNIPNFAVARAAVWVSRVVAPALDVISRIDARARTITGSARFNRPAVCISADPNTGKIFVLFLD
jgi:hypothetical protein